MNKKNKNKNKIKIKHQELQIHFKNGMPLPVGFHYIHLLKL